MADSIFLSHSSVDKERVRQLNADLSAADIKTWFDEAAIQPGDVLVEKIQQAIGETDLLGVVLTPRAVESDWVQTEVLTALNSPVSNKRLRIVPLLFENCELPDYIAEIKYLDFRGDARLLYQKNLQWLIHFIREFPNVVFSPPEPSNRRIFLDRLRSVPPDARAFDRELSKLEAKRLADKVLYDDHFQAVHDLGWRLEAQATGITRDTAIEILECPSQSQVRKRDEATSAFRALVDDGFLSLSRDPREANDPDPGYKYTPLFFGFVNLMRYLGIGALKVDPD